MIPFVDLRSQFESIKEELQAAVNRVLSNCNFILGQEVSTFEENFAQFVNARFAIGVSSGLDALRIALAALDIGPGDEVLVPANTYIATALAVSAVGAKPVFVDCDAATYNIDPNLIERAITHRTRAILPVHLTGQPAEMNPILALASERQLLVVEDAAQAHGAKYHGRSCGSMAALGCFSFYPGKNLGAAGDGGMVTTNDENLARRVRQLRNYGEAKKYEHVEKGLNARLDTLQAAILSVKLPHLVQWNSLRAKHAALYRKHLAGIDRIRCQKEVIGATHVYHLFVVESAQRNSLREFLTGKGIQTGIHYPAPIHLQKAYGDLGYRRGDFPNAERLADRIISLPMYAELSTSSIEYICEQIGEFYGISG